MHAHQPARLRDVAQLIGQREQTHAIATSTSRSVRTLLSLHVLAAREREQAPGRPSRLGGRPTSRPLIEAELSQQLGVSPERGLRGNADSVRRQP